MRGLGTEAPVPGTAMEVHGRRAERRVDAVTVDRRPRGDAHGRRVASRGGARMRTMAGPERRDGCHPSRARLSTR